MGNNQHIRTIRIRISLGLVQSGSVKPLPDVLDETVTARVDICGTPAKERRDFQWSAIILQKNYETQGET